VDEREWFRYQLEASGEALVWALEQIPEERRLLPPPAPLGEWPAMHHMFHMYYNESQVVLPRIKRWIDESDFQPAQLNEEAAWQSLEDPASVTRLFRDARREHIELVDLVEPVKWAETREIPLGSVSLSWVMAKSIQHSSDHINGLLRIGLLWDHYEAK
jgi:hypothetical protein